MQLELESGEFAVRVLYSRAKKSYCRIETKFDNIYDPTYDIHTNKDTKLKIKGISWSIMSQWARDQIKALFKEILLTTYTQDKHQTEILTTVYKFGTQHYSYL